METKAETERRSFERLLARCPVTFRANKDEALNEGSTKDISDRGLGLFSRQKLRANMHLEMRIKLSPQVKPLHIGGKVVWSQEQNPGLWRAGVCFDEQAFVKIVRTLVTKSLI